MRSKSVYTQLNWALTRRLREDFDLPLLLITAKGETSQKVRGFQLGADDYLVKPFEPLELVVRVRALLKRYRIAASQSQPVYPRPIEKPAGLLGPLAWRASR